MILLRLLSPTPIVGEDFRLFSLASKTVIRVFTTWVFSGNNRLLLRWKTLATIGRFGGLPGQNVLVIKILPIEDFRFPKLDIESAGCLICFEYAWQLEFKSNQDNSERYPDYVPCYLLCADFKKNCKIGQEMKSSLLVRQICWETGPLSNILLNGAFIFATVTRKNHLEKIFFSYFISDTNLTSEN